MSERNLAAREAYNNAEGGFVNRIVAIFDAIRAYDTAHPKPNTDADALRANWNAPSWSCREQAILAVAAARKELMGENR